MSEWQPVYGYEDLYEVSAEGEIRSLATGLIRKQQIMKNGYPTVCLSKFGKCTRYTTHRIVTESFMGKRPDGHEVNHIDGDKLNCRASNLEYVTPKENTAHARSVLGHKGARGEKIATAKLTEPDVLVIMTLLKAGETSHSIAKRFRVSPEAVRDIKSGKNWKHLRGSV